MLTQDGVYRLEIINQNNQEEKSVSFDKKLFAEDGVRWVPLFSPNDDFLSQIPEEVPHPRILLIFYRKRMLNIKESEISIQSIEDPQVEEIYEINDEPLVSSVLTKSNNDEKIVTDYKFSSIFSNSKRRRTFISSKRNCEFKSEN